MKTTQKRRIFSVAYNGTDELVTQLKTRAPLIRGVFGRRAGFLNATSGGRALCELVDPEREKVESHIQELRAAGISFNWLMNGVVLHEEFKGEGRQAIYAELDWISRVGVDSVTVSIPLLAGIIKQHFPQIRVHVSVFAHVDTPEKAVRWEDLGVSGVCLDRKLTRDFRMLHAIRRAVGLELELLVNDPCLISCPYELYHDSLMSRASLPSRGDYLHYCSYRCLLDFARDPGELIKSTFIRPEDLEEYLSIGIDRFKVVDRNRPTEWIIHALDAYIQRRYAGNLVDLLSLFSALKVERPDAVKFVNAQHISRSTIHEIWKGIQAILGFYIDNRTLDGFLEFFKRTECNKTSCKECNHCATIAKGAVRANERSAEEARLLLQNILDILHSRDLCSLNFAGYDNEGGPIFFRGNE